MFLTLAVRPGSIGLGFMVQSLGTDDHRIAKMAQQVMDVLPHVPLNVITKDLGETQCQRMFTFQLFTLLFLLYHHLPSTF